MNIFNDMIYPFFTFVLNLGTTIIDVLFGTEIVIADLSIFGTVIDWVTSSMPEINDYVNTAYTPFELFTQIFIAYLAVMFIVKLLSALIPN